MKNSFSKDIGIIYEDKNFLAINKPAGMLTHGVWSTKHGASDIEHGSKNTKYRTSDEQEQTVVQWLLKKYPEISSVGDDPKMRPGIVHRLDRGTSGVLLIAKNQRYFEYLKSLFAERKIRKIYRTIVYGEMKKSHGVIDAPISRVAGVVKRTIHKGKLTKPAITEYRVVKLKNLEGAVVSVLEVMPKTGRTHQIRVHLSSIGHPVVGDKLYGTRSLSTKPYLSRAESKESINTGRHTLNPKRQTLIAKRYPLNPSRLLLHALSLEFSTEEGKRIKIEAEPPREFNI